MSSIDAAIIKALVEHIGGNPDEIPDGSIGGGTNEPIPLNDSVLEPAWASNCTFTWGVDGMYKTLTFTNIIAEPTLGHIIKLYDKTNKTYVYLICNFRYPPTSDRGHEYKFISFKNGQTTAPSITLESVGTTKNEVAYRFIDSSNQFEVPDGTTTGLFKVKINNASTLFECFAAMIYSISNVLCQLQNKVYTT